MDGAGETALDVILAGLEGESVSPEELVSSFVGNVAANALIGLVGKAISNIAGAKVGNAVDDVGENVKDYKTSSTNIDMGNIKNSETLATVITNIDSKVTEIDKESLPSFIQDSFKEGQYKTVRTNEDILVYRVFGGKAQESGSFATTTPAVNRIQSKIDSALLPQWGNSRTHEAEILVPKGTVLNIGKVEEQLTLSGTLLFGGADQILLPQNWDTNWIQNIREVRP